MRSLGTVTSHGLAVDMIRDLLGSKQQYRMGRPTKYLFAAPAKCISAVFGAMQFQPGQPRSGRGGIHRCGVGSFWPCFQDFMQG